MDCARFQLLLHPFIDGELAPGEQAEADAHLATCPGCAGAASHFRALGHGIRDALATTAPQALQRHAAALVLQHRSRPRPGRWRWRLLAAAAAILLLAGGVLLLRPAALDANDVHEVVALHIRSQLPGHLTDLSSDAPDRIRPWFAGQLPFTPWVGALGQGYALVGARLDYCDDQRVAVLVYRQHEHLVNLVCYPAEHPGDRAPLTTTSQGVRVCGWCSHGLQFFAASDLPAGELLGVASQVRL